MAGNPIKTGKYVSKKGITGEKTAKLKTLTLTHNVTP